MDLVVFCVCVFFSSHKISLTFMLIRFKVELKHLMLSHNNLASSSFRKRFWYIFSLYLLHILSLAVTYTKFGFYTNLISLYCDSENSIVLQPNITLTPHL